MNNEAVVTGVGVVTSVGAGVEAFTDALRDGRSGITFSREDGLGVAGRLRDFSFERNIDTLALPEAMHTRALRAGRRAPLSAQVGLVVALEAWRLAFSGADDAPVADRVNLIVAGNNVNQGYQRGVMEKFGIDPDYVPASYALHFMDTDQVGLLSEVIGIRGEGFTVGGASASGNVGLIQGWRQIVRGECDVCVVVGAMADLSPVELAAFGNTGALGGTRSTKEPEKASRPFDADRGGFIFGQGGACVILESTRHAKERGAASWGRIVGGASCLDGNRSSDPSADGEAKAMRLALTAAGRSPEEVDYVNAHGTGSRLGDEVEVQALKSVFGPRIAEIAINSTKGLVGHCLFSAGVVEAVATLIQMREGFVHANANLENPLDQECGFIRLTAALRRCDLAISNAFGFGGINTSIVIDGRPRS